VNQDWASQGQQRQWPADKGTGLPHLNDESDVEPGQWPRHSRDLCLPHQPWQRSRFEVNAGIQVSKSEARQYGSRQSIPVTYLRQKPMERTQLKSTSLDKGRWEPWPGLLTVAQIPCQNWLPSQVAEAPVAGRVYWYTQLWHHDQGDEVTGTTFGGRIEESYENQDDHSRLEFAKWRICSFI